MYSLSRNLSYKPWVPVDSLVLLQMSIFKVSETGDNNTDEQAFFSDYPLFELCT